MGAIMFGNLYYLTKKFKQFTVNNKSTAPETTFRVNRLYNKG